MRNTCMVFFQAPVDPDRSPQSPPHRIWLHQDVLEFLHGRDASVRRLGIILRQIAARGRPNRIKSCRNPENRGWLRTPMGGGGSGMHFYLWWAPSDSERVAPLVPSDNEVFLRTIRHHDNHDPLDCGQRYDYILLSLQELQTEHIDGVDCAPWTPEQRAFIDAGEVARIVLGRPGSGKTASLWRAVERHPARHLLYLTWSRELAWQAHLNFSALAPGRTVRCWHFSRLLRAITQQDEPRLTLTESRSRFREALQLLSARQLGPWKQRLTALHAELRAFLIGRARPGHASTVFHRPVFHLRQEAYAGLRQDDRHPDAIEKAWHVFELLCRNEQLAEIFPELATASQAIRILRAGRLPTILETIEGIVVDEVQDLTLLELSVVVELWHMLARRRSAPPLLLLAGDEGQTVRPSGFRWGPYKEWLSERIAPPRDYELGESLRCPANIARTFERAARYYSKLPREERPARQRRDTRAAPGGHLIYVAAENQQQATSLIQELCDEESLVVVSLEDEVPEHIWSPALIKGLERHTVVVLNPGAVLERLDRFVAEEHFAFDREDYRTEVDRLRVALSRSSETLVFLDVAPTAAQRACSLRLLGDDVVEVPPHELLDNLEQAELSLLERIQARLEEFSVRIDDDPVQALRLALRARDLQLRIRSLGEHIPANIAREVPRAILLSIARLLTDDRVLPEVETPDLLQQAREAASELGPEHLRAFDELVRWHQSGRVFPAALLKAACRLTGEAEWLRQALSAIAYSLHAALERSARRPESAGVFLEDVAAWLRFLDYGGNLEEAVRQLRGLAFDALLAAGDLATAQQMLERIQPPDLLRKGRLLEAKNELEEAIEAYLQAGAYTEAERVRQRLYHFRNDTLRRFRHLADQCSAPEQIPVLTSMLSGAQQRLATRYIQLHFEARKDASVQNTLHAFLSYLQAVHQHADQLEDPELMMLGALEELTRRRHRACAAAAQLLFEHYGTRSMARRLLASPAGELPECSEPAVFCLAASTLETLRNCPPYQNLLAFIDHGKPTRRAAES